MKKNMKNIGMRCKINAKRIMLWKKTLYFNQSKGAKQKKNKTN